MKKLLITGGVLFSVLPAMALDLPTLYQTNATDDCDDTTSVAFQSSPVTMQAVYVTDSCPAGQYFEVTNGAAIDSTTGQITGASCQDCTNGHYCPSAVNITVNNGVLSTQGLDNLCPAGTYADSNRTSLTACDACPAGSYQTQTGQDSCNTARAGYYIADATQTDVQCPLGYRDGIAGSGTSEAACSKTISCPSTCSGNAKHTATCTIDDTLDGTSVAFGSANRLNGSCFEEITCAPGYTKMNLYSWLSLHMASIASNPAYCSPDGTSAGCSGQNAMERGTSTWTIIGADKTVDELHFVQVCTDTSYSPTPVLSEANANFSTSSTGIYCWVRNVDQPNQPWFFQKNWSSAEDCAQHCGQPANSGIEESAYMFGDIVNDEFVPFDARVVQVFGLLASETTNDTNAQYCIASTVTINWGGIENPGDAGTCTYGETFTAPSTAPEAAEGYKFIGWKVNAASNNN